MVCPHHPLYGDRVVIVDQLASPATTHCLVEASLRPGVRYLVSARWLTPIDALPGAPHACTQRTIYLPLPALDRMVHVLRLLQPPTKDTCTDGSDDTRPDRADCDPAARARPQPTPPPVVPDRTPAPRRSVS